MTQADIDRREEAEIQIAALEESLRQRRFWLSALAVWVFISLILAASFSWLLVSSINALSREAQSICLAVAGMSLVITSFILKRQKDGVFKAESNLRKWQAARRYRGSPQAGGADAARERYRAEAWEYVESARRRAARNRRFHRTAQAIIIIGSILVTSLTSAMATATPTNWITVVVSIAVSAAAGLSTLFKWREQSFNLQQTANSIEKEYGSLELRIYDYGDPEVDALQKFAERVEALKDEQRNRELQFEQSPDRVNTPALGSAQPGSAV